MIPAHNSSPSSRIFTGVFSSIRGSRLIQTALMVSMVLCARSGWASTAATDSQADPAYTTWDPGDNGGTGWGGGWVFRDQANTVLAATTPQHGWFVANSTNNNSVAGDSNGDGDINSPSTSKAWGLYSNAAANDIYAIRPFSGALSVGQTLKFDMDNGSIATSQVVGMRLLTNVTDINSRDWEVRFVGGGTNYTVVNSAGTGNNTGIPFTREGLHVELTLTTSSTYSVSVESILTGQTVVQTGTLIDGSAPIVGFAFKNQEAGTGSISDAYFNNIAIVDAPEPSVIGIAALGVATVLFRRFRRR